MGDKKEKRIALMEDAVDDLSTAFEKILRRFKKAHGKKMESAEVASVVANWSLAVVFQCAPQPAQAIGLILAALQVKAKEAGIDMMTATSPEDVVKALDSLKGELAGIMRKQGIPVPGDDDDAKPDEGEPLAAKKGEVGQ